MIHCLSTGDERTMIEHPARMSMDLGIRWRLSPAIADNTIRSWSRPQLECDKRRKKIRKNGKKGMAGEIEISDRVLTLILFSRNSLEADFHDGDVV